MVDDDSGELTEDNGLSNVRWSVSEELLQTALGEARTQAPQRHHRPGL